MAGKLNNESTIIIFWLYCYIYFHYYYYYDCNYRQLIKGEYIENVEAAPSKSASESEDGEEINSPPLPLVTLPEDYHSENADPTIGSRLFLQFVCKLVSKVHIIHLYDVTVPNPRCHYSEPTMSLSFIGNSINALHMSATA